ncbi:amidohydrolase family protein [candidate division KSB1 bacterium]|nr:amidohydrolase family protein [candidate division KSB1 bacterium]
MKCTSIMVFLINLAGLLFAQIQVRELPEPGFEERIREYVNDLWIVDTHEHLAKEEGMLERSDLDFTLLWNHYAKDDLISSGMGSAVYSMVKNPEISVADRWEIFKPFWEASRNTGYNRMCLVVMEGLFGILDLNDDTVVELSEQIQAAYMPGWYRNVLKEKAHIEVAILDVGRRETDPDMFVHVERFDEFIYVATKSEILRKGESIQTLDDFENALIKSFKEGVEAGMVGVKSGLAYNRIIHYENTPKDIAEDLFKKVMTLPVSEPALTFEEIKSLQDYMMHCVIRLAEAYDMPFQIHTGLLAGNGNIITNSKPTHLINLFMDYPDVNFCIFHSAYPYGGELGSMAKNFPNVFIDMCWSAIISPYYSEQFLHEWLESVPANKIMGFGGDFLNIEGTYGHSVMARKIVAKVLTEKVAAGYLTEAEAIDVARRILRDNALEIFKLRGKSRTGEELPKLSNPGFTQDLWEMVKTNTGFIRDWRIIGPFSIGSQQLSPDEVPLGFDTIYPPEKEIEPDKVYAGEHGQVTWESLRIGKSGILDFNRYIYPNQEAIVYAYAEVKSPNKRDVKMTLGSDDGAKVWVNGELVYNVHAWRAVAVDEDVIEAKLRKGLNRILVKVENRGMNWGLAMRVIDPEHELEFVPFE